MKQQRKTLETVVRRLAPAIPRFDCDAVVDHALDSPGLRRAPAETAAWLSLVAFVRHTYTDYDLLMDDGYDGDAARFFVCERMNEVLAAWGARRVVSGEDVASDGGCG